MKLSYLPLILLLASISLISCSKESDTESTELSINDVSQVTETELLVSWTVMGPGLSELKIELSEQSSFTNLIKTVMINDLNATEQLVDGLTGATTYYIRLRGKQDGSGGNDVLSNTRSVTTDYVTDRINFTTPDSLNLVGFLSYLESNEEKKPGIIFIHSYRDQDNKWLTGHGDLLRSFVARGFVCLTFHSRGHGPSDPWPIYPFGPGEDCQPLIETANDHRLDVKGAIEYIRSHDKVDPDKIGLIGLAAGGVAALNNNNEDGIICTVSTGPFNLGLIPMSYKNVFFIATEDHRYTICEQLMEESARTCQSLYSRTEENKRVWIITGSGVNGDGLLDINGVDEEIRTWVIDCMRP